MEGAGHSAVVEKAKRKVNWSKTALSALIFAVTEKYGVIKGKFSNKLTKKVKDSAWAEIAARVNSSSTTERTVEEVRKKWSDFSSYCKKRESLRRAERKRTGGGVSSVPEADEEELLVISILGDAVIDGIPGGIDSLADPADYQHPSSAEGNAAAEAISPNREGGSATQPELTCSLSDDVADLTTDTEQQFPMPGEPSDGVVQLSKSKKAKQENVIIELEKARLNMEEKRYRLEKKRLVMEKKRYIDAKRRTRYSKERRDMARKRLCLDLEIEYDPPVSPEDLSQTSDISESD